MSVARVKLAWLFSAFIACACGGEEFTSGSGGSGGTSSGGTSSGGGNPAGGSSGALPGVCPGTVPSAGSACDDGDRLCTYGVDPRPKCRRQMLCDGSSWLTKQEPGTGCGPSACTASVDTSVDCDALGDECTAGERYCACLCVTTACSAYKWKCSMAVSDCPISAPNAGTGCLSEGANCLYGACDQQHAMADQVRVECKNGIWEWTDTSCLVP